MAKLPRVTVVQFGASGPSTDFGQFGSKTAAAPQTSQNPSVIMALGAWITGWATAAVGAAFNPYLEDMNGFCLVAMYFIANMFERGIPDWDAGTTYYKGATVQDPAGSGQQFYSLTDNNLNQALPLGASNAQWQWNNAPQVPIGTILDTAAIFLEAGFDWCDGGALSRAAYATLLGKISVTLNGTLGAGSPIVTGIASTANLKAGWPVSGTGIPTNTTILSVDTANQVTLTQNALSSLTTALLFAPFGVGNGTTTFNKPDFARRVGVGAGGAATAVLGNVLGAVGGEETHVLTIAEMPAHTHTTPFSPDSVASGGSVHAGPGSTDTGSTGGDGAHNNVQPSLVVNKIIKVS